MDIKFNILNPKYILVKVNNYCHAPTMDNDK